MKSRQFDVARVQPLDAVIEVVLGGAEHDLGPRNFPFADLQIGGAP
jgi:hypothetical protein